MLTLENDLKIGQLTNAILVWNEEAIESNNLHCKEIEMQIEWEEKKKDRTKKIHPAITNMLQCAAATHKNEKSRQNCFSVPLLHQFWQCWIGTVWANPPI